MVVGVPAFFTGLFWYSNQEQKDKNNKHVMYWRWENKSTTYWNRSLLEITMVIDYIFAVIIVVIGLFATMAWIVFSKKSHFTPQNTITFSKDYLI